MLAWAALAAASLLLIGAVATAWEQLRGARSRPLDARGIALYVANQGVLAPAIAVALAALGHAVHPARGASSWTVAELAAGFVLFEATTYAFHRVVHRVPVLLRLHRWHHAHPDVGWLDGFRQHPLEFAAFQILGNLPSVLLFGPVAGLSAWVNVALRFWTAWLHARAPIALGPLEYVLTSPAMHHRHHRRRAKENFGGILSIFDWLGGTAGRG